MKSFATLVWKEWRQLRAVRWSGVLLCGVVLLVLLGATLVGDPGAVNPIGFRTPTVTEIAADIAPIVFGAILWPLVVLLTAVQAFTGERSAGTESLLLLQPVGRGTVWWARVLVTIASWAVTVLASAALLYVLAFFLPGAALSRLTATLRPWLAWQAAFLPVLLASVCASAAVGLASFTVLGGSIVLALLLVGLNFWLPLVLCLVPLGLPFHQGLLFAVPAVAGLFALALWTTARGEPAGTGRWKVALGLMLVALLLPPAAYATFSGSIIEWAAHRAGYKGFKAAPEGPLALQVAGPSVFVVDKDSMERVAFVPPDVWRAAIRDDGRQAAVVHDTRTLARSGPKLSIFDERGMVLSEWTDGDLACTPLEQFYAGPRLLLACLSKREQVLHVFEDPASDAKPWRLEPAPGQRWALGRTDALGRTLVCLEQPPEEGDPMRYGVHPLDPDSGSLSSEPVLTDIGTIQQCRKRLSHSGRYWIGHHESVLDVITGATLVEPEPAGETPGLDRREWLAGDLLLELPPYDPDRRREWADVFDPATGERWRLGAWDGARSVYADVSPGGSHVLLLVIRREEGDPKRTEAFVIDVAARALAPVDDRAIDWAGADTLALHEGTDILLLDLGDPSEQARLLH
jgi:ABC-type transport system involved in multi-copper enzyme maturation permease subunit